MDYSDFIGWSVVVMVVAAIATCLFVGYLAITEIFKKNKD